MNQKGEQKRALALATVMIVAGFLFLATLTISPDKRGGELAVIFPPSMTLKEIVLRIAPLPFDLVRTGVLDSIVVLRPRIVAPISDLHTVGAWLVMDAYAGGGCAFLTKKILS